MIVATIPEGLTLPLKRMLRLGAKGAAQESSVLAFPHGSPASEFRLSMNTQESMLTFIRVLVPFSSHRSLRKGEKMSAL